MAHRIEKPLEKANFAFKLYVSSFSVQSYGSLRYAVLARISSFFKGFWKSATFIVIIFSLLFSLSLVNAADILPIPEPMGLPLEGKDATMPIVLIIKEAIKYVGLLAILALSWGGIQFLISIGNDEKVKHAKSTIIFALVWVLLSVVAYTIIDIVNSLKI